jgi:hypothetical protein
MRKILLLAFVVLMVLVWLGRQRIYVRDPLATVYSDDVKQSGVQVFINYSNDVLLEQDADPGSFRTMVQGWNKMPGMPVRLMCLRWLVCMVDADRATLLPMEWSGKGKYDPRVTMTSREVTFVDGDGTTVRAELR